ncbi:MAG: hypothetical protein R6V75_03525, partial [Bacteroidales bacterium]
MRNHIAYEPYFGFKKGGEMTLLDGRGNSFDQANLLLDLLMLAGYQADYIYGTIRLSGEQFTAWMGIEDDPLLAIQLLADAGIPAEVHHADGVIKQVILIHLWVKLWTDNVNFVSVALDPSFKETSRTPGIELGPALAYDRADFLAQALEGAGSTEHYVQNLNRKNVRQLLASYSMNLAAYLETTHPGDGMEDIIGGEAIIPVTGQPFEETLDYELERIRILNGFFEGRDWAISTMVTIKYQGWEHLFPAYDLYGERLTLTFTQDPGPLTAHLILDGYEQHSFPVTDPDEALEISIDHPYPAFDGAYQDQTGAVAPLPGVTHIYAFTSGFGTTGRQCLEKHRRTLRQFLADGEAPGSEPVMGESLAMIGLTWMAETSRATEIADRMLGTRTINHHVFGMVGQQDSPRMDLALMGRSILGTSRLNSAWNQFGINSAMEGGVMAQMQPMAGVSAVRLLDIACAQGDKIFDATPENYLEEVRPQLRDYPPDYLAAVDLEVAAGNRMILPEHGNLQEGDYQGIGVYSISTEAGPAALIRGGLHGGQGTRKG